MVWFGVESIPTFLCTNIALKLTPSKNEMLPGVQIYNVGLVCFLDFCEFSRCHPDVHFKLREEGASGRKTTLYAQRFNF